MTDQGAENGGSRGRPSKVARIIEAYDLDGLGAELEAAWTAPEPERRSLRELAREVNRRIVTSVLAEDGEHPLPGEVETIANAVSGSEDGATTRDVATRLEAQGHSMEDLAADFVSYQAVRTYLISERNVEYEASRSDPIESARDRIQGLRGRLRAVTEGQLESLAGRGDIDLGDARVIATVTVYCEDCGRQFDLEELLDRGGCDCE
jgi:hypothetical protein